MRLLVPQTHRNSFKFQLICNDKFKLTHLQAYRSNGLYKRATDLVYLFTSSFNGILGILNFTIFGRLTSTHAQWIWWIICWFFFLLFNFVFKFNIFTNWVFFIAQYRMSKYLACTEFGISAVAFALYNWCLLVHNVWYMHEPNDYLQRTVFFLYFFFLIFHFSYIVCAYVFFFIHTKTWHSDLPCSKWNYSPF